MYLFKSPKQFFNESVVLHPIFPIQNVLQLQLNWLSVNWLSEPKTKILGLITCRKAHVHANIISSPSIQLTRWGIGQKQLPVLSKWFSVARRSWFWMPEHLKAHTESARVILQPRPPHRFLGARWHISNRRHNHLESIMHVS
jgi:hypothetical protein